MNRREFHYTDGTSDKFWAIALHHTTYTLHFGRKGTAGQQQTKEFATPEAAAVAYEKAIAECWETGLYCIEQDDNEFCYVLEEDEAAVQQVWLQYQSQLGQLRSHHLPCRRSRPPSHRRRARNRYHPPPHLV